MLPMGHAAPTFVSGSVRPVIVRYTLLALVGSAGGPPAAGRRDGGFRLYRGALQCMMDDFGGGDPMVRRGLQTAAAAVLVASAVTAVYVLESAGERIQEFAVTG